MRLVWVGACALALAMGCGGRPSTPAAPPPGEGEPPGDGGEPAPGDEPASPPERTPDPAPDPDPAAGTPGVSPDASCAERAYVFEDVPSIGGPVACFRGFCVENAPPPQWDMHVAGERGALWAIGSGGFLRQAGERWVATCAPRGVGSVTAVHGQRSDDVWVGDADGRVVHWDGRAWRPTPLPVTGAIAAIWGDAREAFAAVRRQPPGALEPDRDGALLRWDGAAWRDTGGRGERPWGNGAGRAWALDGEGILEWSGAGWDRVRGLPPEVRPADLWAAPGGDLWVVGAITVPPPPDWWSRWDGTRSVVLRREAGTFVDAGLPARNGVTAGWIRGTSDADVWVPRTTFQYSHNPVYRWDGAGWTELPGGFSYAVPHVLPGGEALLWHDTLHRLDGAPAAPAVPGPPVVFGLAAAAGPGEVWLGGDAGLWRLDGRTFRRVAAGPILALDARAPDDAWAISGAELLHWDGAALAVVPPPASATAWAPRSVVSAGPGRAWVATEPGAPVWRWDGNGWEAVEIPIPPGSDGVSIASGPEGDLWALGRLPPTFDLTAASPRYIAITSYVLHREESGWTRSDFEDHDLRTLAVTGRGEAWAFGNAIREVGVCAPHANYCPGSFHLVGGRWEPVKLVASSIAAVAANDIWAAAASLPNDRDAGLWHWDGHAWTRTDGLSMGVFAALPGGELWGSTGTGIVHRRVGAKR